jgi:biuret amidohydrolase
MVPSDAARRTAVLVIDLQCEFIGGDALFPVPGGETLVPRIAAFADELRAQGATVVFTAFALPAGVPAGRTTARLGNPRLHRLPDAALLPQVQPGPDDLVIDKPRQSAFVGTALDLTLRRLGVEHVVVTGVTTHACCLATAIDAAALDYEVTVVSDLTAAPALVEDGVEVMSADQTHRAALSFLRFSTGAVKDAATVVAELGAGVREPEASRG